MASYLRTFTTPVYGNTTATPVDEPFEIVDRIPEAPARPEGTNADHKAIADAIADAIANEDDEEGFENVELIGFDAEVEPVSDDDFDFDGVDDLDEFVYTDKPSTVEECERKRIRDAIAAAIAISA